MIPLNLSLSNFTSYPENPPELDFTKFKLAAISGLNGAGKSSLLDAITWCIWGTSRAGDSSDDLIHLGQENMQVEFSFQLDGHIYIVKRRRSKKGGGSTALEVWSGSHNLTEGTIKMTQEKIIQTLHLTFDTFTNSAYIRQGHADEFTTKGPTERKRILADILGLDHYDTLEEKAKEKAKDAQIKLQLLDYQLLEIEAELSQKEEREKSLSLAEAEAKKIEAELLQIEELTREITKEHQATSATIKSFEEKRLLIEVVKKELEDINLQISLKQKAKEEFQNIIEQKEMIEKNYHQLEKLTEIRKSLEVKRSELIKHKDQLVEVQKILVEREEKRAQAIKLLEIDIKKFQTENEQLMIQIKHLSDHKSTCPTCRQSIDDKINKEIVTENNKKIDKNGLEIKQLEDRVKKYQSVILPEKKQAEDLERRVKQLEQDTKEWFDLTQNLSKLEKFSALYIKLQQAETGLKTYEESIKDLKKIYDSKIKQIKNKQGELEELEELENKLKESQKKLTAQESVKTELSQKALNLRGQVGEAKQLVTRSKQLENFQKEKLEQKSTLQKEKDIFEQLALAFGKKGIQAMIIETAIPEIEDEANSLLGKLSDGRMKISLQTQKETKTKVAGGEKGIVETLDIIISDEMGERSYEMYSVDGSELVYIRQDGQIESTPIEQLWSGNETAEKQGKYELQNTNIKALCYVKGKAIWKKVDKILRHKSPKKILEVKCGPGNYTVKLTKNHSIYVMTPEGLKVKRTEELKTGDYLLSPKIISQKKQVDKLDLSTIISTDFINKRTINRKPLNWDENHIWSRSDQRINRYINVNKNWGKLMGISVAEGSGQTFYTISAGSSYQLASESTQLASSAFGTQERVLNFISKEDMKRYTQDAPGISSLSPKSQYRPVIGGRLISHIIKNLVGDKASMKRIPTFVFNASKEVKLAFLKGLVAGDGYMKTNKSHSKSEIGITTISTRLAGELIFLCRQLGIWARLEKHGDEGFRRGVNHQKSYRVVISGKKNLEALGFGIIVSNYDTATKYEGIPYDLVGVSRIDSKRFPRSAENRIFDCGIRRIPKSIQENYLRIQSLVSEWNILEVKEVKEINPTSEYVYDLMIPGNNSFVAGNGALLIHNSGGEAFRVNFAIRLAISKLLTHRAGAKLQFLVIDEGFGSQDAPGRAKLVEVIDAIKNDFEKILIITHIEELKEEFPIRVEVSKNGAGSTFELVGV